MTDAQLRRLSSKKLSDQFFALISRHMDGTLTPEEAVWYERMKKERERRQDAYRVKLGQVFEEAKP